MSNYDPQERELVKKLDMRLIPFFVITVTCFLLDRLAALEVYFEGTDVEISENEIINGFIFYGTGFMCCGLGMTLIIRKYGPSRIFASLFLCWGLLSFLMVTVTNQDGLYALRFFQGLVQSGVISSILVYLLYFYTREEIGRRISYTISISTIIREIWGLIFHSLSQKDASGLSGWEITYIFQGSLCLMCGGMLLIYIPDYPETAWWLTPSERQLAVARGRDGEVSHISPRTQSTPQNSMQPPKIAISSSSILDILRDIRLWFLSIIFYSVWAIFDATTILSPQVAITSFDISPAPLNNNASTIHKLIADKGKASLRSIFMSSFPFFVGGLLSVPVTSHSDSTSERIVHAAVPLIISLGGFIFLMIVPASFVGGASARYFTGILPATAGVLVALPSLIAYAIDSVAGDVSRCTYSFVFTVFGLSWGQMIMLSRTLFNDSDDPGYIKGLLCLSGLLTASIIGLFALRYLSSAENQVWGKPPGLRRLLNDVEEEKAWDNVVEMNSLNRSKLRDDEACGDI